MLLRKLCLAALMLGLCGTAATAEKTRKLSGKIRSVKDNLITIEKAGLVGESSTEVLMNASTKVTGQIKPGLRITVKYVEGAGKDANGERHKIAVEIETRPEYASKEAKKAAKHLEKK